jgi:uncharacterized membrane protein YdjX (TVP38/TMEM64 family)
VLNAIRNLPGLRSLRGHYFAYVYHPIVAKLSISLAGLGLLLIIASQPEGQDSLVGIHNVLSDHLILSILLLAFLFATSTISPFFPEYMLTVTAGFILGTVAGSCFAIVAITLAASGNFLIARHFGRRVVHFIFDAHSAREVRWTASRISPVMVFLIWLLPSINFDLVSYAGGLSKMPYRTFVALTVVGTSLSSVILSFLGSSLRSGSAVKAVSTLFVYTLIGIALYVRELPPWFNELEPRELTDAER